MKIGAVGRLGEIRGGGLEASAAGARQGISESLQGLGCGFLLSHYSHTNLLQENPQSAYAYSNTHIHTPTQHSLQLKDQNSMTHYGSSNWDSSSQDFGNQGRAGKRQYSSIACSQDGQFDILTCDSNSSYNCSSYLGKAAAEADQALRRWSLDSEASAEANANASSSSRPHGSALSLLRTLARKDSKAESTSMANFKNNLLTAVQRLQRSDFSVVSSLVDECTDAIFANLTEFSGHETAQDLVLELSKVQQVCLVLSA